ncbi:osmoprotectant NAGGN system M42 family peptidase [Phycisphaerales bacterium AB-hyl4]|uniref:Osmoprotectant NAGGN system M42 family peptidase n=1 Tax=Natronomicrosphaera hydrolytica TaxID=3242702 RepID=A0ABV4U0W2_9BACT
MNSRTAAQTPRHAPELNKLPVDRGYLISTLLKLLAIPSPSGYTDSVVHFVGEELQRLGVDFELTRRGAIRATVPGRKRKPNRAVVAHLDTLGAMVKHVKPDGRVSVVPIGTWSSRFAEGARVTIFTDEGNHRGTILPNKASGHVYDKEIDTQPVAWDNVEIRLDEHVSRAVDVAEIGIGVGDFVAIDPQPEVTDNGFIVSRHLDNKAGVACLLTASKAILEAGIELPIDCHLLFTIFEEVGSGASAVLHRDVAEMVSIDNATPAPNQSSTEHNVTIAMKDSSGPFDYHLTRKLLGLCRSHGIPHGRDVFKFYRCDAASAVEAGNDIRTALICFGVDASHGWERTHLDSLNALTDLISLYMQSPAAVERDRMELGPLKGFPDQPTEAPPVPERQHD